MMRWRGGVVSVLVFAMSSVALAEPQLGAQSAKLLLTRAGFAPSDAEVAAHASLSYTAVVLQRHFERVRFIC